MKVAEKFFKKDNAEFGCALKYFKEVQIVNCQSTQIKLVPTLITK